MRKMVMTAISVAVLGYGNLMAQEKVAESVQTIRAGQLEKLGAMKGRIQSKVIELQKLMDPTRNGAAAAQAAVQKIHLQTSARLAKLILEENAKPQEMRNMAQVDNYNNRTQKLNEMLAEFNSVTWGLYGQKAAQLQASYAAIVPGLLSALETMEVHWVPANLDLGIIVTAVTAVEKRLDALKVQFAAAVTEVNAALPAWEAAAKE
jgi:hypothetical protein